MELQQVEEREEARCETEEEGSCEDARGQPGDVQCDAGEEEESGGVGGRLGIQS